MKTFKTVKMQEPVAVVPVVAPTSFSPTDEHLPKLSTKFLFAGKAVFTVTNSDTGEQHTFKLRGTDRVNLDGQALEKKFFLNIKCTGGKYPYRYIGLVDVNTGRVITTARSDYKPPSKEYNAGAWAVQVIVQGKRIPLRYQIEHAGRCGRCARMLLDPASKETGIGPECVSYV